MIERKSDTGRAAKHREHERLGKDLAEQTSAAFRRKSRTTEIDLIEPPQPHRFSSTWRKLFPRLRSLRSGIAISPGSAFGVFLLVLALGVACQDTRRLLPVAPGQAELVDRLLVEDVGLKWSPYVGVHIDARAIDAYRDALSVLRRAGRLNGLRVEINKKNQNAGDRTIKAIGGLGLELLGLIGNEYLFELLVQ